MTVDPVLPGGSLGTAGRQRLHPLTPLVRGSKFLVAAVAAMSWRGFADLGLMRWLLSLGAVLIVAVAVAGISWFVTGYEVIGRELRVYEGLISRRTRAIPLERVQAVDLVRPLVARLLGLAELRLEVIGARKTEAPLAYLAVGEAAQLRGRLVALVATPPAMGPPAPARPTSVADPTVADSTDVADPTVADPTVADPTGAVFIHAVNNRQVLLGQLLTPQAWAMPIGVGLVLIPALINPNWSFIGLASTLTALAGVLLVPVRRVLGDWGFRVAADATGFRLRHGLLDTRSQTVPPGRIQAVGVTWPLLWRMVGWQRTRIDVAGYGTGEAAMRGGALLPVADATVTRRVAGLAVDAAVAGRAPDLDAPRIDIGGLPLHQPPPRSRWLAPIARRYLSLGVTDDVVAATHGVLTRHLVVVPLARIQSVRVVQGPVQRRLRLASVHVDTAGSLHVVGQHRDAREAHALALDLADRSRAARAAHPSRYPQPHAAAPTQ